ncbi:MAG: glycosyltransferase family 9 protein [Prevotella sp.]|nr:glycosyltransferase family 9 protein [Prevotella sp.]MDD5895043.1 glycosyltransferase family 9 protein [Prevotellaceae bacterium]
MKKEHILVIRFSALGDVAMTVPVVHSLAKAYPELRITVLSKDFARPLFEDLAPNVNFMGADLKREYKGVKGLNALYRRLTAKNFTAIADFHNVLRSDYLRLRFNIDRYKVAHIIKDRSGRRRLVASTNKKLVQQESPFIKYADTLARLGYPVEVSFKSLFPEEGGNLNLLPALVGPKKNFETWIGIAPFAAHEGKIYPARLMWQVVKTLLDRSPHVRVFLFGKGQKEEETLAKWCNDDSRCVNVASCLETMQQELILMSHLDVMVSMDSANMHLASLTATPVVSIWGATHPLAGFMGWGQTIDNAVQLDLPCRPCSIFGNKPCMRGDYACLRNISPEQVVEKVEKVAFRK